MKRIHMYIFASLQSKKNQQTNPVVCRHGSIGLPVHIGVVQAPSKAAHRQHQAIILYKKTNKHISSSLHLFITYVYIVIL